MTKHKRDVSTVVTGGDGGSRMRVTSVLRGVATALAVCLAAAATPAGAATLVRDSVAQPPVASERVVGGDVVQPRVAQGSCAGSGRTLASPGGAVDDLTALIVAAARVVEGETPVSATSCGHNLQCYPSLRACAAECCGVCERRINCGGATAHKCFE